MSSMPSGSYALPCPRNGESLCRGHQQSKQEGLTNKGSVSMAKGICRRGPPALLNFVHLWSRYLLHTAVRRAGGKAWREEFCPPLVASVQLQLTFSGKRCGAEGVPEPWEPMHSLRLLRGNRCCVWTEHRLSLSHWIVLYQHRLAPGQGEAV